MATVDESNGFDPQAVTVPERSVEVTLSLVEAQALRAWLLKPTADGRTALDDSHVNAALKELGGAIDRLQAVDEIRRELEEAGLPVGDMDDAQLAELGRKIGRASSRALR